jgi:chorismate mutase
MDIRSLRGAINVADNTREAILQASKDLLQALVEANQIQADQVMAVFFSATGDLTAAYPAEAARIMGWKQVALHCFQEMHIDGSLPMCLRVTVLWETEKGQSEMVHCYLGRAAALRPDWSGET